MNRSERHVDWRHTPRLACGWLGVALGSAGVLVCMAALIGVWVLHARIQRPLDRVAAAVTNASGQTDEVATSISSRVQVAREAVGQLDARVRQRVREGLRLSDEDLAGVREVETEIRVVAERVRAWVALADAALALLEQLVGMGETTVAFLRGDRAESPRLLTRVRAVRSEIARAGQLVEEAGVRLTEARADRDRPERPQLLQDQAVRLDEALLAVQHGIASFAAAVLEVERRVADLQHRLDRALRIAATLLSLLLVWQMTAQFCLAREGWRLRGRGQREL